MSKELNKNNFKLAKQYVEEIRGDMSVSWRTVLEQLEELAEMCESSIEAMKWEHKEG